MGQRASTSRLGFVLTNVGARRCLSLGRRKETRQKARGARTRHTAFATAERCARPRTTHHHSAPPHGTITRHHHTASSTASSKMAPTLLLLVMLANVAVEVCTLPASVPSAEAVSKESEANPETSKSFASNANTNKSDAKAILDNIKIINDGLDKNNDPQTVSNKSSKTDAGYVLDEATLDRIKEIIAAVQADSSPRGNKYQDTNSLLDDDLSQRYSKALRLNNFNNAILPATSLPYITTMPVMVIPQAQDSYGKTAMSMTQSDNYQGRQDSQFPFPFPFQLQWPLASFFPILVKDPLLGLLHGGGWNNFLEIGQSADVCSRRQKSRGTDEVTQEVFSNRIESDDSNAEVNSKRHSRVTRSATKQSTPAATPEDKDVTKKSKKIFTKPANTRRSTKKPQSLKEKEVIDTKSENEGDLRFPFSDFSWFGNKKPVAPSPGFFINKMKVRRGGVAIAGPGGVATAGRGGTAVVGPGGLAYTQPGGVAVAGPAARVIALSPYADLTSLVSRLHQQSVDGSIPRSFNVAPEGRLVATGPVVYFHPYEQTYSFACLFRYYDVNGTTHTNDSNVDVAEQTLYHYDGMNFGSGALNDPPLIVHVGPVAAAVAGPYGVAVANPVSRVVAGAGRRVSVVHSPQASAVAGPGGVAHAQASTQYLPFYGGAKGQYLEVKKDTKGFVVSEKIVAEESISSENILKNNDDSLLYKVFATNLMSLRTAAGAALKLLTLGRKTGTLSDANRARLRGQLAALADAASSSVKLLDEIGDNVDALFSANATLRRRYDDSYEDDTGDDGVGIDAPDTGDVELPDSRIAEAKPIGLAVIGESGLAASRPFGTAVATSGVALARPIGTAIAGIDPTLLGIDFQISQARRSTKARGNRLH
ncbi:uncharacterized protein [Battus philenor]|uniref:uncharacterized protein n=1 Tax=Battus philenor TaxID=42288 RepID=UPI0035D0A32D